MKLLVTGSNGFLGAALVERLLAHGGRSIRCFVRPGSDRKRLDALCQQHPELEIFEGNLNTVENAMAALEGIDLVYHVAAGTSGAAADLFLGSVIASKNLLEAMVRTRFPKIVLVSSFGVYGTAKLPANTVLDESAPLEEHPEKRDLYSYAKWRQEKLFWEYQSRYNFPLVVVRPGVIYGPSGPGISSRVGIALMGFFLFLGGRNRIPLSYVENCAESIAVVGSHPDAIGQTYNLHDDDLPTCASFLSQYRRSVKRLRVIPVGLPALLMLSRAIERYHKKSQGQLPMIFSEYKTLTTWKPLRYSNQKLKALGYQQIVPTATGIERYFSYLKTK